jgi:hypothetical protein
MLVESGIMTRRTGTIALLALLAPTMAGCAGDSGRYPSLAQRDVERASGQFEPPPPPVEPLDLPIRSLAPTASIAALVTQASGLHRTFLARSAAVRNLVAAARGSGPDSDARGQAIVALADLASLRSQTEVPLGDLDLLIAERTNRLEPADEALAAHAQVLALVTEQDRAIAALSRVLGQ